MGDDATVTTTGRAPAESGLAAYRDVLRLPGVGAVTALSFGARIPATAVGVTVTLHVVLTLGHGFAAAGLVAAAITTGMAVGAPVLGIVVDRFGLRPAVLVSLVVSGVFWTVAPLLSYTWLLVAALAGGVFALPVFSLTRQILAAAVPEGRRRPAFALDSMSVEMSYMTGPALGSLLTLVLGSTVTMRSIGAGFVLVAVALLVLDPPVSAARSGPRPPRPPVREWLRAPLVGALLAVAAAIVAIMGTELAFIAALTRGGEAWAIAVVNAVWCVASLVGGFLYGAARRDVRLPALLAALGVATLPAALGGPWWTFALLLIAAGLCTAPTLAAGSNAVADLASDRVRGVVAGLQGSATTAGMAIATPLSGVLVDAASPAVAIVVCGAVALVVAGVSAVLMRSAQGSTVP
ncbi:putative MFS family arabinose efflux permease [Pseudonocardia endophytica]|uniref:Putative MFS family arabinose efflux permease n=1 Tax=Pseudonocardia endophytica TaxID=401976 RepID=A0A4R1HZZ6_PSEEN|nr:putative MFS family arabinose efflux permease [Pseudonocardia endophytica]